MWGRRWWWLEVEEGSASAEFRPEGAAAMVAEGCEESSSGSGKWFGRELGEWWRRWSAQNGLGWPLYSRGEVHGLEYRRSRSAKVLAMHSDHGEA